MKASSTNLDIKIKVKENEIFSLPYYSLEGILKFDDETIQRDIPLTLKLQRENKEEIDVELEQGEDKYFGNANHIIIIIYSSHYDRLLVKGSCGGRFYNSGKAIIYKV